MHLDRTQTRAAAPVRILTDLLDTDRLPCECAHAVRTIARACRASAANMPASEIGGDSMPFAVELERLGDELLLAAERLDLGDLHRLDVELPVRLPLHAAGIRYVEQLQAMTEAQLLDVRGIGRRRAAELMDAVDRLEP